MFTRNRLPLTLGLGFLAAMMASADSFAAPPGTKPPVPVDRLPSIKELPDPFLFDNGTRVQSSSDWDRRRAELKELVQTYEYGHLPPSPGNVQARELQNFLFALGSQARDSIVELTMGPGHQIKTHVHLTVPAGRGPFPVIIRGDLCWGRLAQPIREDVIKRGYILAEFDRTDFSPDRKNAPGQVHAAYPQYDDMSAVAAWAWGFHRVVDYVLTRNDADPKRIAITGHSRGGKCALLAGAMDDRIALTVPNNSGCGGAGCYRHQADKSEDIAAILKNFPYWFQPRFNEFIGKEDRLPIDQHTVKALLAPRALLTTEALGDLWANPEGTQVSHAAARTVYDFLGASDKIGIYWREGKHDHNHDDWLVLLDFADQVLSAKNVERKFDALAFPGAPKRFSWSAPR